MLEVCGIGNCGSFIVIKTVAAITDLDCFEDIVARSFEVHDGLFRVIIILELLHYLFVHFSIVFYFTKVTHVTVLLDDLYLLTYSMEQSPS